MQADAERPETGSSGRWAAPWEDEAPAQPAPEPEATEPQAAAPQPPAPQPPAPQPPAPPAVAPAAPVPPADAQEGGAPRPRRRRRALVIVLAAAVLVAGVVTGQLVRPVPDPTIRLTLSAAASHTFPGAAPALPWPAQGQSAVHVEGLGPMGASGGSAPTPTASVAKVMTAYVYLRGHPLRPGEPGPVLTVSPQAAAQIPARRKREESLLGVTANQRLTQRKALEALMIISANDVAHELARWDSGDEAAFVAKMNAAARELGMTGTTYTDPSGYDSRTVSTAADQVKLLRAAMKVPAFAEIVDHPAYIPDGGGEPRPGGNILLGQYGVVGGKTGYTDAAGGNFVFAARKRVAGVTTLIVGAVMGQRSTSAMAAVTAGQQLVAAAEGAMTAATLAPANAPVARIDDGLGGRTPVRVASALTVVGWPGLTVPVAVEGDPPHRAGTGARVGMITAGAAKVPLKLDRPLKPPSPLKKLIRLG
ncbi:D-alanyl-D-alanine carboxypeptidase [Actinomadura graeca]|uniref:D-alanyl-D-alanine carboxypeptidase n=1 Tax=Actinomadura graeca TaxID=2750812 RepID=A0ABX8R5Y0_9ACTN|nr:D-alanyl-D-alanine carboxypeptidase [Actinomadura graeca]